MFTNCRAGWSLLEPFEKPRLTVAWNPQGEGFGPPGLSLLSGSEVGASTPQRTGTIGGTAIGVDLLFRL